MKVAGLWSAGKDSCFACYKAISMGHDLSLLFNFTDPAGKNSLSHGLSAPLILKQAQLSGIPMVQKAMPQAGESYRKEFKALIRDWKMKAGIAGIVFGDIYLKEHKEWIDAVCRQADIEPIMPLWGRDTKELILEIIDSGFKAVVVAVKADILGKEWLGRIIDREFIEELKPGIDPCGEKGEFHTLVVDGPMFKEPIKILEAQPVLRENLGKHWFLDIKKYA
ncbi:MAG: diphthine--ammonia ligase [Candidatus Omnitrophica bacterium]|nr:diphthine--ammonia ligase [Candidatus Omnitrophota bacterium]